MPQRTFNFDIPYNEVNEHPSTANLTTYSEDVDDYIHRLARSGTSLSSQPTLTEKTKAFVGYFFNQKSKSLGSYSPKSDTQSDKRAESEYLEANQDNNKDGDETITTTPPLTPGHSALGYNLVEATHSAQQLYTATISTPQPESSTADKKNKGKQKQEIPEILVVADIDPETVTPVKKVQKPKKAKPAQNPPIQIAVPNPNPPINNPPQQQQLDDDEMAQTTYPVFDGTNPRKWIFDMEIAFIANNIQDAANSRKIGLAVMNLGPAKMWYVTLNPKPTTWIRANDVDGFKELFLAKYATEANKAQASQQAQARTQRPTETVNDYLSALEEIWMECGDAAVIPEWMKVSQFTSELLPAIRLPVKQQAPQTMADAVQAATNCYYALQSTMQPSHSAEVNNALLEKISALEVQLAELKTSPANASNNNNRGFQQGSSNNRRRKKAKLGSTKTEQSRTGKRSATSVEGSDSGNRIRPSQGAKQYGDSDVSGPTYCSAFVEEVESRILVDTGSSVTIISSEHFRSYHWKNEEETYP
ncbi:1178_t:CDS:2 [Paraglomus occultum]|uniref:1178_t:CDS:1 n=1 Tax=Paraglomus occultum TaxID=144539 RepID=A0A9N9AU32_9GLOM|nr:1178_t:CDS:2 [Paraglomus occultum]